MMTIGEMYRRSGGVALHKQDPKGPSHTHKCEECMHFKKASLLYKTVSGEAVSRGECLKSKCDREGVWKSNYTACKFFKE